MPDAPDGFLPLVVIALATWRVAVMIVREDGPFSLCRRWREFTGVTHDESGEAVSWPPGSGIVCVGCVSLWVVGPVAALWLFVPWAAYLLAASAGAVMAERAVNHHA